MKELRSFIPHLGWFNHDPDDEVMTLLQQGHFEAKEQAFLWLYLRPGDCFLDVGAHFGLYSVLAAAVTDHRTKIISIEPDADTSALLKKNLDLHEIRDAEIVRAAIWREAARLRLVRDGGVGRSSHNFVGEQRAGASSGDVAAITLDQLIEQRAIERVDFAKIDIEGAELSVLTGAVNAINKGCLPLLMVEFTEANLQRVGNSTEQLYNQLTSIGYCVCDLDAASHRLVPVEYSGSIWYSNLFATVDIDTVNRRLDSASSRNRLIADDILARAKACSRFKELQDLATFRHWAEDAEMRVERAQRLAKDNQAWAERTVKAFTEARKETINNRAWAERTEELLAEARKEAINNRAWAERTEELLAEARKEAINNRAWAERTEEMLAEARQHIDSLKSEFKLLRSLIGRFR